MGDIADDDLLNDDEEFDHEGYNLSDKEEDALLEGEDYDGGNLRHEFNPSSVHSDKKQTHEDSDDLEDDVLDLDIEEDFQDVEDKTFEEKPTEKKQEGKFSNERPATSSNTTNNNKVSVSVRTQVPTVKPQSEGNKVKVQNRKKAPPKIERRNRGTGRGNFQSRGSFTRSNLQKDRRLERRNTVFINPKYEGIVHINENNARLAWDNQSYQQSNSHYIQPWAAGSIPGNCDPNFQDPSLLINNLVSEMVNISQTPANLFPVPTVQPSPALNFFEPPQPPQPLQVTFQVSNRETFPSQISHPASYQSTGSSFNSQSLTDRYQNDSNSYNYGNYSYNRSNSQGYSMESKKNFTSSNYGNRKMNYNRTLVNKQNLYENSKIDTYKTSFSNQDGYKNNFSNQTNYKNNFSNQDSYKSNFSNQDDYYKSSYSSQVNNYQNEASNYLDDGFETRKPFYGKTGNYDRPTTTYQTGNLYKTTNSEVVGYNRNTSTTFGDRNLSKNEGSSQNNYYSTTNLNSRQPLNQNPNNYNKNDYNKTNASQSYNRNLTNQQNNNRRPLSERIELPEKKLKTEENANKVVSRNEETNKPAEQSKQEVPSNSAINDHDEDEEMRLYRLKIEEQKREREKVLKMKEERRKMMLQQQKKDEDSVMAAPEKQQQPVVTTNTQNKNYNYSGATAAPQQQRSLAAVPQQQRSLAPVPEQQKTNYQQPVNRIPVLTTNKPQYFNANNAQYSAEDEDDLPNFTFKVSNNLQNASATVPKTEASSSSFMSNRVVVVKNSTNQKGGVLPNSSIVQTVPANNEASKKNADVGQGLSSFFNNRKVLKKDNSLVNTRLVSITNLAASTTQNKLVAMTRGIGEIQKLQMDKQERQATILFKSVASAHAFFKKYQRHMLDLSVIGVKLEPMI